MTDRSKTVVMLIDWDNLQICHSRDAPGTELDLQALIALAQSYGTLVSARAYAEWNLLSERLAVYKAGIEPVFAPVMRPENSPREGKSLADTVMVADGVDLLWTVAPDVFVLATSDKDMIPLARIAKQRGAAVVVLGSDLTAIPLVEMSNVFISYRQLLRELDRVSELEAPVGRAPARERRLRESRRPSSEPYGGSLGSGGLGQGGSLGQNVAYGGRSQSRSPGNLPTSVGPSPVGPSFGAGTALPPAPSRRSHPPAPAQNIASTLATPVPEPGPSLVPTSPPEAESPLDTLSSPGGEAVTRRRRRRGGRGRRPGVGQIGEADSQTEQMHGSDEDGDEDEAPVTPVALVSTPEDIDDAVLRLLASRDRDVTPAPAPPPSSPAITASPARIPVSTPTPQAESPSEGFSAPSLSDIPEELPPPPPPKRLVRTSFSSFGPPEGLSRSTPTTNSATSQAPSTPASTESAADRESEQRSAQAEESPTASDRSAEISGQTPSVTSPETGSESATATPREIPEQGEPAANEQTGEDNPASAEATDESKPAGRSSQGGRATRSRSTGTRRTRRPAGVAASVAEDATGGDEAANAEDESTRTPRRRRTRRPTRSGSGSEDVSAEAASAESAAAAPASADAGA
ncbi:MAG: NYN domain-containing protein [Chloroflexota bacterium]